MPSASKPAANSSSHDRGVSLERSGTQMIVRARAGRFGFTYAFLLGMIGFGFVAMIAKTLPALQKIIAGCLALSIISLIQAMFGFAIAALLGYITVKVAAELFRATEVIADKTGLSVTHSYLGIKQQQHVAWNRVAKLNVKKCSSIKHNGQRTMLYAVETKWNGKTQRLFSMLTENKAKHIATTLQTCR